MAKVPAKPKGDATHEDVVRSLAKLLDESNLTEIEVERDGLRVRVARHAAPVAHAAPAMLAHAPAAGVPHGIPTAGVVDPAKHPGVVTSPMVGTAYRSSQPGAKPFADIGTTVKAGDTLLIIEAMKTMNQIPAPRAGTVTQVLFEDGQPVEYGQPLIVVE